MTCGFIDIQCHINAFLAPIWYWLQIGFWSVVVIVVVVALAWIYRNFGWWGIGVALTVGIGGFLFKKGYDFGNLKKQPLNVPDPDKHKPIKPRKLAPGDSDAPGTWNYREGRWN